jgi:hypothetical protein
MSSVNAGWSVVDPSVPILTYVYSFGPGIARSLAVRGAEGLIVVSPPCRVAESAFTELEAHGKVTALVASNAFHHMGLASWKARFPSASVFAPAQSITRVEKHSKVQGIRPLSEAGSVTGPHVELVDMPHYKTGEVLVRIRTQAGMVWYLTDVVMNLPALPGFPFNLLFGVTRSAPGLRLNGVASLFMMKDRRAVWRWLKREVEQQPPALLLPCHGDVVRMDPPGRQLLDAIALRAP